MAHMYLSSMTHVLFLHQLRLTADGNIYTQWVSSSYEIQAQESRQSSKSPKEAKDTNTSQPNSVPKLRVRSKLLRPVVSLHQGRSLCKAGRKSILLV